jgi:hypothetical protein
VPGEADRIGDRAHRAEEHAMMRSLKFLRNESAPPCGSIPFPGQQRANTENRRDDERPLRALEHVSRRLDDLARRLNCLGFYDERDPDRPRAA